jgi:hypothetical protein
MRLRRIPTPLRVVLLWLLVCLAVPHAVHADIIDLTDLSSLPVGVSVTGAIEDDDFIVRVDGEIHSVTVDSFFAVNGVSVDVSGFQMGTGYALAPGFTAMEFDITPLANGLTTFAGLPFSEAVGINYVRFDNNYVFLQAQLSRYAGMLGVPVSSISYGYRVTSVEYTPTGIPEPATLSLLSVGAGALWLRRRRRRSTCVRPYC